MGAGDKDEQNSPNRSADAGTRTDVASTSTDRSSEKEPEGPATNPTSDRVLRPALPTTTTPGRPGVLKRISGQQVGVIAAVLAVLVGLATWLLPHPGSTLCRVTARRFLGCNDVPDRYLGTWKGQVVMQVSAPVPHGIDQLFVHRAERGDPAAEQHAVDWRDENGPTVGCSHTWQLGQVQEGLIELKTDDALPANSETTGPSKGCANVVRLIVQPVGDNAIEITGLKGESTSIADPYPAGTAVFKGTLYRVTTG